VQRQSGGFVAPAQARVQHDTKAEPKGCLGIKMIASMTSTALALPFDRFSLVVTFFVTIVAFSIVWLASLKTEDAGLVDYYWGLGFPIIGWLTLALSGHNSVSAWILLGATTLWALRLTLHMVVRHRRSGAEDPRYAKMRAAGGPGFKRRSLFTIFWLQAVLLWLIGTPLHALGGWPLATPNLLFWLGMKLFAIGFVYEAVADWQLMRFRADPRNKGQLLTRGLFALSRHPNYFGEVLLWWGLALATFAVCGSLVVFVGPAVLSLVLIKVSGPPMLAGLLEARPGYDDWVRSTPVLVPRLWRQPRSLRTPAK
jgi:steroid 5-alpha reductase family enzyme